MWALRGSMSVPAPLKVPLTESQSSAPEPPMMSTSPLSSSVAVWLLRPSDISPALPKVRLAGSQISVLA